MTAWSGPVAAVAVVMGLVAVGVPLAWMWWAGRQRDRP
jgi:uncharacterized membrane protein YfbV (UPF0208 family)